jgi:hypothetical protein
MDRKYVCSLEVSEILGRASAMTSVLGVSRTDDAGNMLYDALRLTEDDSIVAQQFLREAVPEINSKLLAYRPDVAFVCGDDSAVIVRLRFEFVLHEDGFRQIVSDINECILNYFAYYVVYSWLAVKKPDEAAAYGTKAGYYLDRVSVLLNKRKRPVGRTVRWI